MKSMVICTLLVFLIPHLNAYGESWEPLQIDIIAGNGERPTHHGIMLKVYQNSNNTAMDIWPTSNPYQMNLPLDHRYKIEAFASSMFFDVDFVDFVQPQQKVDLSMPAPGSVSISVAYSDGFTPIQGAIVSLRSSDHTYRYWTNSTTDSSGNTARFWLQPTLLKEDKYVADIFLGDLVYTYSPIRINPGLSQNIKIVSPWPKVIEQSIVVSVLDSDYKKISGLHQNLTIEVHDGDAKVARSTVNHRGDAYFSNLKVGNYLFRALWHDGEQNHEIGSIKVILTGKVEPIEILSTPAQNKTASVPDLLQNQTANPILANSIPLQPLPVPSWIKDVAGWWAQGQISDSEFLKAIEYLFDNNIITIDGAQTR